MKCFFVVPILLFLSFSFGNAQYLFQEGSKDWEAKGDAIWSFSNGELTGTPGKGGFVITKDSYKNFLLELEFKPDSTINSGVFLRCQNREISPEDCYEINIWDHHPNQDFRTGSVVMKFLPLEKVETIDAWNRMSVDIKNNSIKVLINDVLTVDFENSDLQEGYIALQAFGEGAISFRNIKIKPYP